MIAYKCLEAIMKNNDEISLENPNLLEQLQDLIDQTYVIEREYEELKSSHDSVEQLVDLSPNALWILELNGDIFLQNSKARDLSKLLKIIDLSLSDSEISDGKFSYIVKVGRFKDKILLSVTDNTEQKNRERLATMGQMAAHLSHEIRNPIGSISLLSSTLYKRVDDKNKPIVEEIQKSVFRIDKIIKATLMFSKGVVARKLNCSLDKLLVELNNSIAYYSYSKDIKFSFSLPSRDIFADFDLLSMMISNFIFNAIDAIEEDEEDEGLVELEYFEDENFHIFKIFDSGVPIEDKEILFEAFKSTKEKGNGLGLVLSMQIAREHDGSIKLLDGEKKGFEIKLKKQNDN